MVAEPSLALTCAFLCSYAYAKDRVEPAAFRPRCSYAWRWPAVHRALSDWKRFSCAGSDLQVLFAYRESDRTAFVVFRGTDSLRDAVVDAAVLKRELPFMQDTDPDARVHAGFLFQHKASVSAVREYLARHPDRSRTVVTGHSLGGAVATLCAALLRDEMGEARCRCCVFGCPRVGNPAFVSRVDELLDLRRFVVGYDPVASIPTRVRWKHAGKRVWYVNGTRVRSHPGDPWANALVLPNLFCVRDHDMAGYIDSVAGDALCGLEEEEEGAGGGGAAAGQQGSWWRASVDGIYMTCLAAVGVIAAWIG